MLYTVSSRYRKAKDVCSHSRLFLSQGRPQRSMQGYHYRFMYDWSGPEGAGATSSVTSMATCPTITSLTVRQKYNLQRGEALQQISV